MNWIEEGAQVPKQVWAKLNERKMDPLIRNRHYGKTHKPMNWIDETEGMFDETMMRELLENNISLTTLRQLNKRIRQQKEEARRQERERIVEWVKENGEVWSDYYKDGEYVPQIVVNADDLINVINKS